MTKTKAYQTKTTPLPKLALITRDNAHGYFLASALHKQIPNLNLIVEKPALGTVKKIKFQLKRLFKSNPSSALLYLFELPLLAYLEHLSQKKITSILKVNTFPDIPTYRVPHINSKECWKMLEKLKLDSSIVYGSSVIGKTSLKKLGKVLNCHMGIVPQYRGAKAEFWALYQNDDTNLGYSIHECIEKLDAGDLIYQAKIHSQDGPSIQRALALQHLGEHAPKIWLDYCFGKHSNIEQRGEVKYYSTPRLSERFRLWVNRGYII